MSNDEFLVLVGQRLKTLRVSKGFKQRHVAVSLGIQNGTVSDHERGRVDFPITRLMALCKLYEIGISDLLGKEELKPLDMTALIEPLVNKAVEQKFSELEGSFLKRFKKIFNLTLPD